MNEKHIVKIKMRHIRDIIWTI